LYAGPRRVVASVAHITAFHRLHIALRLLRCLRIAAHLPEIAIAIELTQCVVELRTLRRLRISGVHVQDEQDCRQHREYNGACAVTAQAVLESCFRRAARRFTGLKTTLGPLATL
jgi:hypothetical protein